MIDTATQKPIRVEVDPASGPYIRVSVNHLEQVRKLLTESGTSYWGDKLVISVNGRPAEATINLSKRSDPGRVQALLDAVA
jgi:hypothetical protein